MKRILAVILMLALLAGCCAAAGEEAESKYERLTVGLTTAFNGNFLADAIGSNVSDQDIRKLIHSYGLVHWDSDQGLYRMNPQVISDAFDEGNDNTYRFVITRDLKYSDGTPITAKDYAFTFLLLTSRQLLEAAGSRDDGSRIVGWKEYDEGTAGTVAGFRIIGDYQISITIAPEYVPYFYEMKVLDLFPLPIHQIIPGCEVKDDGNGIYLSANFGASLLARNLLDPETGYASHPTVSCGPYTLQEYDGTMVRMTLNPEYKGDANGEKPEIPEIVARFVGADELIADLAYGEIDLAVRCARTAQVQDGTALTGGGNYSRMVYSRNGLSFISFCGEKGPTADVRVRRALSMCLDKELLTGGYLGNLGIEVKGYYGIGQWMFLVTQGTLKPTRTDENGEEIEEEVDWESMNLDGLQEYPLDPEQAKKLLAEAGWTLDAEGGAWSEGLRYRRDGGQLVPLRLKLIYPDENEAGPMLEEVFAPYLREAGAEIELVPVPMPELLQEYYGQKERDCDMILLGTNFSNVFDPSGVYDENGKDRLNGITAPELAQMAADMRRTEPGEAVEYVRKWIRFQEYRTQVVPEIPLYSNAYMDFFISALRDYAPGNYSSWAEAVQYAVLSDYMPEADEEELGDDEFLFD